MHKSPDRHASPFRDGLRAGPRMPERSDEVMRAMPGAHFHPAAPA